MIFQIIVGILVLYLRYRYKTVNIANINPGVELSNLSFYAMTDYSPCRLIEHLSMCGFFQLFTNFHDYRFSR
jgi:hypothetical protein